MRGTAVTVRTMRGRRLVRIATVVGLVVGVGLIVSPESAVAADSVTKSVTVERHYINVDGTTTVVDPARTVKLTVDHTTNLRSLELVHVSWSGARPTAGIVGDQNSDLAQNEEYPMVLLECRGVDSATAPTDQRLSPNTCWTQFADERFYFNRNTPYSAWRSDAVASAADRATFVDQPNPIPANCKAIVDGDLNEHWLPFDGADKITYPGGPFGCAGQAPEAAPANQSSLSLPSNETFGVSHLDGTGQADFDIFTGEDHSTMGCSTTVPCSLVAIPIMGINCDSSGTLLPAGQRPSADDLPGAQANCETTGRFEAGKAIPPAQTGRDAVDGTLWWSPSNWARRMTVPLTFAPPDNACGLANSQAPLNVYGSELLAQATTQWSPVFCLNPKLFNFNHVQTPEPQAATLLNNGSIEAAFISRPLDGGFATPTVTAPVGVTGFGIAFAVDDQKQNAVVHLKLNARLLAKLLTESYPDLLVIQQTDPDLSHNPVNIEFDPEFQALNPGVPQKFQDAAATLLSLNSDSDVLYALTSYINADPEARAWLDGQPDPWGMTVNPAYKKIALPVQSWPLLDTFTPSFTIEQNPCFATNPVPYLPLVASPTARLFSIGQDMQFAIAQSQTVCITPSPDPASLAGAKVVAQGRQQVGARFMLGVVSLGDAAREGLHLAGLETHTASNAPEKFTDATGRTFTEPTTASLAAAAKLLKPDSTTGTWPIPYSTMRTDASASGAYPGTMVVYGAVPTRGLKSSDASDYAKLLSFAATAGQQPGAGQGKLPDGYLPMTAANGLSGLVDYTQRAAAAIAAQKGDKPPLVGSSTPPNGPGTSGGGGTSGGPTPSTSFTNGTLPSSTPTGKAGSSSPTPTPTSSTQLLQVAKTDKLKTGAAGIALPLLSGIVVVTGAAALGIRLSGKPRAR